VWMQGHCDLIISAAIRTFLKLSLLIGACDLFPSPANRAVRSRARDICERMNKNGQISDQGVIRDGPLHVKVQAIFPVIES